MKQGYLIFLMMLATACTQPSSSTDDAAIIDLASEAMLAWQGTGSFDLAASYPELDETTTYRIQQAVFARQHPSGRRAGFKAGLTSSRAQTMLKTDHPASGYLLSSGQLDSGDTIDLTAYTLPFIEMELGYRVKAAIHSPVDSPEQMRALVSHIYPALELPDIGFDSIQQVQLNTFIAHNAGARQFIIGKALPIEQVEDPNAIMSQCYKNDELLAQATGADALGNQWEALRFLINQRIELGEVVQPEDILITGALGPMFPFSKGQYRVDYGRLGTLQLTIQ